MAAQNIIRNGARWMIGTGNHVTIWADPWIPDMKNLFVESTPGTGVEDATIASLKNELRTSWDEDVLSDLFNGRDKILIHQILLSIRSCLIK